ncbi:NUDIX hydrolase domain-like protein [Dipodascopsis uninucleata]
MTVKLIYTICFIKRGNSVLLLNRQKAPWMGRWNGVGGKIDENETPLECIKREVQEETELDLPIESFSCRGIMTWYKKNKDGPLTSLGGMYIYTADIEEQYETPRGYREGILDWKTLDWALHIDNTGIVPNVKAIMKDGLLFKCGEQCLFETIFSESGDLQQILLKDGSNEQMLFPNTKY